MSDEDDVDSAWAHQQEQERRWWDDEQAIAAHNALRKQIREEIRRFREEFYQCLNKL